MITRIRALGIVATVALIGVADPGAALAHPGARHGHGGYIAGQGWGPPPFLSVYRHRLEHRLRQRWRHHRRLHARPVQSGVDWAPPVTSAYPPLAESDAPTTTDGRYCREFTSTAQIGGETEAVYGTACWQPDGTWEVISTHAR